MFASFTEEVLHNTGTANNNPATALSMGFTAMGISPSLHKRTLPARANPVTFQQRDFLLTEVRLFSYFLQGFLLNYICNYFHYFIR